MFTFLLIAMTIFLMGAYCYLRVCLNKTQKELQDTVDAYEHELCLSDDFILKLKHEIDSRNRYIEVLNIYNKIIKDGGDNTQSPPSL